MSDLIRVTRAELFKLVRRPAAWVLLATAALLNQVFAYVVPYLSYRSGGGDVMDGATPEQMLAATLPDQLVANTLGGFPVFAGALALVLGALMFGGEYGWGTIKTLFTQRPGRLAVMGGQFAALAVAVFVGVAVLFVLGSATSVAIAAGEVESTAFPSALDLVQGYAAGALIMLMWACLGAVLGVGLRSIALPIGLGVVWTLGIENLVSAMAGSVLTALEPLRDVLPGVNAGSLVSAVIPPRMMEAPPGVTTSVEGGRALATLLAYVVVCVAVAIWSSRRDVT
jgi:ABC-2 type transport system permease protein